MVRRRGRSGESKRGSINERARSERLGVQGGWNRLLARVLLRHGGRIGGSVVENQAQARMCRNTEKHTGPCGRTRFKADKPHTHVQSLTCGLFVFEQAS